MLAMFYIIIVTLGTPLCTYENSNFILKLVVFKFLINTIKFFCRWTSKKTAIVKKDNYYSIALSKSLKNSRIVREVFTLSGDGVGETVTRHLSTGSMLGLLSESL